MAIHLTPEQESRIEAMIKTGAFPSAREVLDAALSAVESATAVRFDGSDEELEGLLLAGLSSAELSEGEFWGSIDRETKAMLADREDRKRL